MRSEIELTKYAHCVGESNFHLQLTPKYRKPVFLDKDVKRECELAFQHVASDLGIQLAGIGFGPDHAHLFVTGCKNYSVAELARRFKGASSRAIRQKYSVRLAVHDLYGYQMWSDGYFHRSVGAVNNETMKKYVTESQQKHWTAQVAKPCQTSLLEFN